MHEYHAKLTSSALSATSQRGKGKGKNTALNGPASMKGYFSSLRHFDIYPKLDEDFRIQTPNGGLLSLVGWVLIAVLVLGELRRYTQCDVKEHMLVDTTMTDDKRMQINIDISFHALTCAQVHLDAMDVAGDNQIDIGHDIRKQRISPQGSFVGDSHPESLSRQRQPPLPKDYCGSCYGAETAERKCCNTCEDIRVAYEAKGWSAGEIMKNSTQCNRERMQPSIHVEDGEGCRISGMLVVNRVAGNFHIAHGESMVREGRHIHQFSPQEAAKFNASHTIHKISFGSPNTKTPENPLDGRVQYLNESAAVGMYQYFMEVTPTVYTDQHVGKLETNQFAATERLRHYTMPKPDAKGKIAPSMVFFSYMVQNIILPGVFFIYDFTPYMIEVQRECMPLWRLFTKLCAIVGGVFTLMGVLDSVLFGIDKLTRKK